ncbi:MAG: TIGR04283 family arsenosugar biosynthesis glycosyltransferase [Gammaproteobacteria bacterium]|nr:TIGR04283 family arsenosugar biosynthesis glycosyltransferase [Gammaproteobacteria bacterium]
MVETSNISISIIIPTLNEAGYLSQALTTLFDNIDQSRVEVIISDGGSQDATLAIAGQFPCRITSGAMGRSIQMNQGSQLAKGEWLFFMHADSSLPVNWRSEIENAEAWGFFPVKLSGQSGLFRIIEYAMSLRSSITNIATGDQGLFFKRSFFNQLTGFPEIPIMEDIAISKNARQLYNPGIANSAIITSSRRWEKNGIVKTVLLMWWLRLAYWFGASPDRLHRLYYPNHCR